jgi:hypothetical protein
MATVTFDVGGKVFRIATTSVYKSDKLTELLRDDPKVIFLNYNYDAFAIVLDYLRHDEVLVPPSVCAKTVEIILDDLQVYLPEGHRQKLRDMQTVPVNEFHIETDLAPPEYSPTSDSKHFPGDKKTTSFLNGSIVAQLESTVHQKLADLIIRTIRPCLQSQALQGSYHTTYVLLPGDAANSKLLSEFPGSKITKTVLLDEDMETFLGQTEVYRRFEGALRDNIEVPFEMKRRDVFLRSENEFGIYSTNTVEAILIDFELR